MTVLYKAQVQDVINQVIEVDYSDLTSGVAYDAIKLPAGATLLGGTYWVLTAYDSATSAAATVTFNGLTLINDTDAKAKVRTEFTMPTTTEADVDKVSVTTPTFVKITATTVGATTAGKIRVAVNYIIKGRSFTTEK